MDNLSKLNQIPIKLLDLKTFMLNPYLRDETLV
jgi:hypothetical protein